MGFRQGFCRRSRKHVRQDSAGTVTVSVRETCRRPQVSLSAVAARDKYVKIAAAARRSSAVRMPGSVWSEWHGGPVGSCVGNGGRRLLFAGTACVSPVGSLSLSPDRNRICYGKSKTIHRRASGTFRRRAFLAAAPTARIGAIWSVAPSICATRFFPPAPTAPR